MCVQLADCVMFVWKEAGCVYSWQIDCVMFVFKEAGCVMFVWKEGCVCTSGRLCYVCVEGGGVCVQVAACGIVVCKEAGCVNWQSVMFV